MIDGSLFTRNFLLEGVTETADWQALESAGTDAIHAFCKSALESLAARKNPNEAQTG